MALMAAKTALPAQGDVFSLSADFGAGPGAMSLGQLVKVTGVHAPGTPGLGYSAEDTVTADFTDVDNSPRTLALPLSEFAARFAKVD